jgi:uncharacterized membrane protein YcfT
MQGIFLLIIIVSVSIAYASCYKLIKNAKGILETVGAHAVAIVIAFVLFQIMGIATLAFLLRDFH